MFASFGTVHAQSGRNAEIPLAYLLRIEKNGYHTVLQAVSLPEATIFYIIFFSPIQRHSTIIVIIKLQFFAD